MEKFRGEFCILAFFFNKKELKKYKLKDPKQMRIRVCLDTAYFAKN